MEFINDFKYKQNHYCKKIKESKFFEKKHEKKGFNDICEIIIKQHEMNYELLNETERDSFIKSKKLEIATIIEDINFKELYNSKFSKKLVSNGLQNINHLSSLLYLNEHYKCNCVIFNKDTNKYYQTSLKDFPKIYCEYKNNSWFLHETNNENKLSDNINDISNIIHMDIETIMIYKLYLKSLSIYKLKDLQDIASELNISIINEKQKKKTKQELYNEINLKQI
jgi:hypothetical protein